MFDQPKPTWHEVPDTRTATRGPSHLHDITPLYKDGLTLYTNLMECRAQYDDGSRNLFGSRRIDPTTGKAGGYEWITYAKFLDEVTVMASAMVHELGLTRQAPVGVLSKNRYEWVLVEHAANRMAYQLVPLYDILGPEAVPFIINQTVMKIIFVGKQQLPTLLQALGQCPSVQTIVQFEELDNDAQQQEALA